MFGTQDIILIAVIVVVLFGATRLPQIGSGIGQAIRNFKKGIAEADAIDVTPTESSKKEETKESLKKDGIKERED
jgi:sec-independent protein translocase protein TatA